VKVSGTATLNAPRERVWAALNDPSVLVRTIPGCEQLEAVGSDRYRMTITAGVASIKGTYLGDVALTDPAPPGAFVLRASGAGAPGTVSADVLVTLDDAGDGTTLLRYDADAVVGGAVGGVGQRVLSGVAKKTAGEFFRAVDAVLAEQNGGRPVPAGREAVPGQGRSPSLEAADGAPSVDEVLEVVRAGETGGPDAPGRAAPGVPSAQPQVFTRPAGAATGGGRELRLDLRPLAGAVVGAAIALIGVWVGARLPGGRRR
jgi:hypothetical protein